MSTSPESNLEIVEDDQDVIIIENLLLQTHIGMLESERRRTQTVCFTVEIRTVSDYRKIVQETGQYISYADAVDFMQKKAASGEHVDLVEQWAEDIANFALQNPLADRVTVPGLKPDIFRDADGVGIRIVRKRSC